jgi:beta-lactamase class A
MGIGLGVIAGTALKLLAPRLASGAINAPRALPATASPLQSLPQGLPLGRFEPHLELTGLSQAWARLAAVHKDLKALQGQLVLQDLLRVCGPNQLLFGNRVIYLVVVDIQDSPF